MPVIDVSIRKESLDRYLTYALSVVSGRALPDVRDGLKPVQRRILYAMLQNLGLKPSGSHRKSATVIGEVLGKYHPHGDIACYEALVRMAQDFSLRYPLVDGQGNFGSLDGDSAAAYRYTEVKLRAFAIDVLGEIDQETVDFRGNFDSSTLEPVVLPSKLPNLLVNGASGIAVGMATNIPPHNLRDVVKAAVALSEDPEISIGKLAEIVKAPDFPTGCLILNTKKELDEIYKTGKGLVRMRGEWQVEEGNRGKRFIIISSIPYTVNKAQLVEKIATLIVERKIPQLNDIRDESTDTVRVVLELTAGADPEVAMAYLYKHSSLETNFAVNLTALVPTDSGACRPELLSLKQCLRYFLDFREQVTRRKLSFERKNLLERIHILEGLVIIYDALDEVIRIVRKSDGRSDAAEKLRARFKLSEVQSFAVVDMRIYQLSRTNIEEVRAELKAKKERVKEIDALLGSQKKLVALVRKELEEAAKAYDDNRRCKLMRETGEIELREEDYVVQEDVYAIVTKDGWLKRIRQGNELASTRLREGDSIAQAHALSTLDSVAFITSLGSIYLLRAADFPPSSGYGDPIQKLLKFKDGERVVTSFGVRAKQDAALLPTPTELKEKDELILLSAQGMGVWIVAEDLAGLKRSGKRIMKIREGDALVAACRPMARLALFTRTGYALTIKASEISKRENAAVGVVAMGVRDDDRLIAGISFERKAKLILKLESGRTKELSTDEVEAGHRALKGKRVITQGEITGVDVG